VNGRHFGGYKTVVGLLLLLALLLTWWRYDVVHSLLVAPLIYLALVVWLDFVTPNQRNVLALLAMVGAFRLVLLLMRFGQRPPISWPRTKKQGPVSAWLDMLSASGQKGFAGKMLMRQLSLLLVHMLERREQRPHFELWSALHAGRLPLAPEVQTYLQTGQSRKANKAVLALRANQGSHVYIDPEVEALVGFLEDCLEKPANE
jgi:hypothetical protein